MLAQMKTDEGIAVPIEAVNAVLLACARGGRVDTTFATADSIEKVFGLTKDVISYNCLLRVAAVRRAPDGEPDVRAATGLAIFQDMRDAGIAPNEESYFHLVQLMALAGSKSDMEDVLEQMQGDDIEPSEPLLILLNDGCMALGLTSEAAEFREMLAEVRATAAEAAVAEAAAAAQAAAQIRLRYERQQDASALAREAAIAKEQRRLGILPRRSADDARAHGAGGGGRGRHAVGRPRHGPTAGRGGRGGGAANAQRLNGSSAQRSRQGSGSSEGEGSGVGGHGGAEEHQLQVEVQAEGEQFERGLASSA
ncbi:hypothetical protein JKP88DRAFT_189796 [Tribonema minus]|uniref:Pentacotripeptide-repeat region of PRORP domain-containing protein n=1 Tax=Tribonema minus TaxID=303371 RepID=A0A836C921_9STRA|nr:hypothetical protein JKP88DRAFT_189796 [Tribonema minus]